MKTTCALSLRVKGLGWWLQNVRHDQIWSILYWLCCIWRGVNKQCHFIFWLPLDLLVFLITFWVGTHFYYNSKLPYITLAFKYICPKYCFLIDVWKSGEWVCINPYLIANPLSTHNKSLIMSHLQFHLRLNQGYCYLCVQSCMRNTEFCIFCKC